MIISKVYPILSTSFLMGLLFCEYPVLADVSRILVPDESVVELGMGYNTVTGEFGDSCTQGQLLVAGPQGSRSGLMKTEFELRKIENLSQLKGGLELNLSASLGLGSYIKDPKVSYFYENNPGKNIITLMVRSRAITQLVRLQEAQLKSDWAELTKVKSSFLSTCGNQFVQSVTWGGEFLALVNFEVDTEVKRQKVAGLLGAIVAWVSGNAELARTVAQESKDTRNSIRILRKGGGEDAPDLEIDKIIEYARSFPSRVAAPAGAVPISAETRSYSVIRGVSRDQYFHLTDQEGVLARYEDAQLKARNQISQWSHVSEHPELYEGLQPNQAQLQIGKLQAVLDQIGRSVRQCTQELLSGCVYREPVWPQGVIPARRHEPAGRWQPPTDPATPEPILDDVNLVKIVVDL